MTLATLIPDRRIYRMTTNIKNALKGAALISAMAFGLVISTSTNVAAQNNRGNDRDDDRYGQQDRNRQNDRDRYSQNNRGQQRRIQAAFDKGYRDGIRAGQQAARGNRNNRNNGSYGTNNGYYGNNGSYGNSGYGNNGGYSNGRGNDGMQQAYQQGYQRGYQEALNGNRNRNQNRRSSVWPF